MCYQLTFFCEKLQQVKSLSQAHLTKASPSSPIEAKSARTPNYRQSCSSTVHAHVRVMCQIQGSNDLGQLQAPLKSAQSSAVAAVVPCHHPDRRVSTGGRGQGPQ